MAEPDVTRRPLPESVTLDPNARLTPNEIRALKVATGGRPYGEVMHDEADAMQALVWVTLRRQGYEVDFDEAGDVLFVMDGATPDPTNGARSTPGPRSVGSGV